MSILEGGEFKCGDHDFKTENVEEWYKHCESKDENGDPIHMESGSGECIFCHKENVDCVIPYTRPGTIKGIVCDSCKKSQLGDKSK